MATSLRHDPLTGRFGYWLRQFGDTGEALAAHARAVNEGRAYDWREALDAILQNMQQIGGGNVLCLKVADGLRWQGSIDVLNRDGRFVRLTPIIDVDSLREVRDHCWARGVAFMPVVVPRGVAGEAEFHGQIGIACGALMTDLEPYAGFWDQSPLSLIPVYCEALRAVASAELVYLVNQPDPRRFGLIDARVQETAKFFDAVCGQHYVGWESVAWIHVDRELQALRDLLKWFSAAHVTLYGIERVDLALAFWAKARELVGGAHVFAFGPMNAAQLQAFATALKPSVEPLPLPGHEPFPPPFPPPPLPPTDDERDALEARLRDLQAGIEGVAGALNDVDRKNDQRWAQLRTID